MQRRAPEKLSTPKTSKDVEKLLGDHPKQTVFWAEGIVSKNKNFIEPIKTFKPEPEYIIQDEYEKYEFEFLPQDESIRLQPNTIYLSTKELIHKTNGIIHMIYYTVCDASSDKRIEPILTRITLDDKLTKESLADIPENKKLEILSLAKTNRHLVKRKAAATLLLRQSNRHPGRSRIDVIDAPIAEGQQGNFVAPITGTWKQSETGEWEQPKPVDKNKRRLAKMILNASSADESSKEAQLGKDHVPHLGMKAAQIDKTTGAQIIRMKHLPGTSLEDLNSKQTQLPLAQRSTAAKRYALCMASLRALKAQIHDRGVIHQDIKTSNILVDQQNSDNPIVNIIDIGGSKLKNQNGGTWTYTRGFCSPEQWRNTKSLDEKSDIWSMAITLIYTMVPNFTLTMGAPFQNFIQSYTGTKYIHNKKVVKTVNSKIKNAALNTLRETIIDKDKADRHCIQNEVKDIIFQMLDPDPKKRPTLDKCIAVFEKACNEAKQKEALSASSSTSSTSTSTTSISTPKPVNRDDSSLDDSSLIVTSNNDDDSEDDNIHNHAPQKNHGADREDCNIINPQNSVTNKLPATITAQDKSKNEYELAINNLKSAIATPYSKQLGQAGAITLQKVQGIKNHPTFSTRNVPDLTNYLNRTADVVRQPTRNNTDLFEQNTKQILGLKRSWGKIIVGTFLFVVGAALTTLAVLTAISTLGAGSPLAIPALMLSMECAYAGAALLGVAAISGLSLATRAGVFANTKTVGVTKHSTSRNKVLAEAKKEVAKNTPKA